MGEDNAAGYRAALRSREAHEQFVEADTAKLLLAAPETLVQALHSILCPVDAAVLATDFANFAVRSVREGIGERRDGLLDDDIAHTTPYCGRGRFAVSLTPPKAGKPIDSSANDSRPKTTS
jgi:hypothetical protein